MSRFLVPKTFEEIATLSQQHGKGMFQQGDKAHLEAMQTIQGLRTYARPKSYGSMVQRKKARV